MKFLHIYLFTLLLPVAAFAIPPAVAEQPQAISSIHTTPPTPLVMLTAQSYLLYDYTTKQVLLEKNAHTRIEPASLTKLMTAYVVFSALKQNKFTLGQKVTPTAQAIHAQPTESRMLLQPGKSVTIEALIKGLIVVSANDAARVLAESIATNETNFAAMMNQEAQRLGLLNTHFVNATGLPDAMHYSSAHDLALLSAAILSHFPEHAPLFSVREIEYNHIKLYSRNRLLWQDPYVDGMKTGHTKNSGYSLIASANRDNHRLISVVMNTNSENLRNAESQQLLNYGFQNFEFYSLYSKNSVVSDLRLWKGTANTLKAGIREGLSITLPKGQRPLLKATIETQQPLLAPISSGQQIGTMKLTFDGKPYLEFPLVALEAVPLVNVFSRGIDSIRIFFNW
jgi:serine-type D-Ala-D-Ala carboxypeptidase (penicillin-binding protein 5/6)